MEYIPETKLIPQYKKIILQKIRFGKGEYLPYDTIKVILTYCNKFLNPEDSIPIFWINLGTETCNLEKWCMYCYYIILRSFGTSHKYSKLFNTEPFTYLQGPLDAFVCGYYPYNVDYIHINENIAQKMTDANWRFGKNELPITNIFYRTNTIKEYPVKDSYVKDKLYKKTLTTSDLKYILIFIKRLSIYLNYLTNMVNKLPYHMRNYEHDKYQKNRLEKIIRKLKKKCDKMNIVNDITIKERND